MYKLYVLMTYHVVIQFLQNSILNDFISPPKRVFHVSAVALDTSW